MSELFEFEAQDGGERIDKYLAAALDGFTRSAVSRLTEDGNVKINGVQAAKNYRLRAGDRIEVCVPDAVPLDAQPENIPLDIVYEDGDLLVVNKPKGMVVHPAAGNYGKTLVNALLYHCGGSLSGINGVIRPGIVHRIDKDTSGLLVVAKNDAAHISLAAQIKEHSFHRVYQAVAYGRFKELSGTVNQPIGRSPKDRKKMAVTDKNSKNAVTHYQVICQYDGFAHIKCVLETGRTHQIRVHMAYIGHPIAGDAVYGPKKVITTLGGQCLHAAELGFVHPSSGEYMEFHSELPGYFTDFLSQISGGAR